MQPHVLLRHTRRRLSNSHEPHEQWHEGLEDASRLYFGDGNVRGMLDTLLPLHVQLTAGDVRAIVDQNIDRYFLVAWRADDVGARREGGLWQLMRRRHAGFFDRLSAHKRSPMRQGTRRGSHP